jgi:hypothetical protein
VVVDEAHLIPAGGDGMLTLFTLLESGLRAG